MIKSMYTPKSRVAVIDDLVYDVDKAIFIADFPPGWHSLYKTKNGNYFVVCNQSTSLVLDFFLSI